MGLVSGAVLDGGGQVVGIVPRAMVAAGGEGAKINGSLASYAILNEPGRETVCSITYFFFLC
jgi:hypothetical protein